MADRVQEYMMLPYVTEVVPEQCTDGSFCYRAYHPELPGCMSHGTTPEEAIANLAEAKRLYIEILLEKGQPIPKPQTILTGTAYQGAIWTVIDMASSVEEEENIKKNLPEHISQITQLTR